MEKYDSKSRIIYKKNNSVLPFEPVENLSKKRPSSTKLDLQKLYQESLELTSNYKKLIKQNEQLKEQFQRVEAVKQNRQNLIFTVEKIVEEKAKQIDGKPLNNFSWLVFKLNNKIYELKSKIQAKEKAILDITLSKQSDDIRQKESEIECLNEMIDFAKKQGLIKCAFNIKDHTEITQIKEIVWMEQEIKQKQCEIIQAEKNYEQESKQVRKIMQELAKKKAELKSIKEMQTEYIRAQEVYKQQKRRKQQKIAGNKSYQQELQHQREIQQKKLEDLKNKYRLMQDEQNKAISDLKSKLQSLKIQYEQKKRNKEKTVLRISEEKVQQNKKKQVKRVSFDQVAHIGKNLNYQLALRGICHNQIGNYFNSEQQGQFSIKEVFQRLKLYPFCINNEEQALLIARYVIEDTGQGYFLEDIDTRQKTTIIKSVLSKIIGEVKVYSKLRAEQLRLHVGKILLKFGKLVEQTLEMNESLKNRQALRRTGRSDKYIVTKQVLHEALESSLSSLQCQTFQQEQIQFTIFYLFSFSKNLKELQFNKIFTMISEEIPWPNDQ